MINHTQRFTGRVENYIKYRPSYPQELICLLRSDIALSSDHLIADIGSGTGILSKMFLEAGNQVLGIEPNQEMREAAELLLAAWSGFKSIDASAENTTLADQSVDLITAGQAFHWFDPIRAQVEFKRILRPNGSVAFIWNCGKENSDFWTDYESFMLKHGTDYAELKADDTEGEQKIHGFFGGNFIFKQLENYQELDLESFTGRFHSLSHTPTPGHPKYDLAIQALSELFDRYQKNGRLRIEYDTRLFIGRPGD